MRLRPTCLPAALAIAAALAALLAAAAPVLGSSFPRRTARIAAAGEDPNGSSGQPSVSADGRFIAFASTASNFATFDGNGRHSDIYRYDVFAGSFENLSIGDGGVAGDGDSLTPSISADGAVVAFASRASNLVPGDSGGHSDIFVRERGGALRLITRGSGGAPANGDSLQPALSADGRFVAFTSSASDLVRGDRNRASDVFVCDLASGAISLVSESSHGAHGNHAAENPSISADGRYVSFASSASNLVSRDRNRVADVFVRDRVARSTRLVSVSSGGRQQNAAVAAPFSQVSSISADGRYVAFDSDATDLVAGDRNGHTDVFRRDLRERKTVLVSRSTLGAQGDNDSFAPAISADGQIVAFESLADDLAAPWAPLENVIVRDVAHPWTTTVDVAPDGSARGPEVDQQLLQQVALSGNGLVAVFESGASNLVAGDFNGADDLFLRALAAPRTLTVIAPPAAGSSRRARVEFRADDPLARTALCRLDGHTGFCPLGKAFRLPELHRGRHVLNVRAGGPGMLADRAGVTFRFRVR